MPSWAVMVTWLPLTEPCSETSLASPAFRSAAAFRPLMAIATVTCSPLLRPANSACNVAPACAAVVPEACAAGVPEARAAVLPGLATRVLAQRKITASTTTAPSVTRGPRLVILLSPPTLRARAHVPLTLTCPIMPGSRGDGHDRRQH